MEGARGHRGKERHCKHCKAPQPSDFCQCGSSVLALLTGWSQLCQAASHVDAESWKHEA